MSYSSEDSIFLRLVNRYISVWVWSILFGVAISLSFSVSNVRGIGRYGVLSIVLIGLYVVAALATLRTWFTLLHYLNRFIIPLVFMPSEDIDESRSYDVFKNLSSALVSIIVAFVFLFLASLLQSIFDAGIANNFGIRLAP